MRVIKPSFVLLLAAVLVGCATTPPAGVQPVTGFDVDRYAGRWYEIARFDYRFERGLSNVTADYTVNDNGTVTVVNRGYDVDEGKWKEAEGKARFTGDATVGSLKVSFFGPFYGGYFIFDLDPEYRYALVAGDSKEYLWILAREPHLDEATYSALVNKAASLGFPTDELIKVSHDNVPVRE